MNWFDTKFERNIFNKSIKCYSSLACWAKSIASSATFKLLVKFNIKQLIRWEHQLAKVINYSCKSVYCDFQWFNTIKLFASVTTRYREISCIYDAFEGCSGFRASLFCIRSKMLKMINYRSKILIKFIKAFF